MGRHLLDGRGLDLEATLTSGQSFSWQRDATVAGRWRGWMAGRPCAVWQQGAFIAVEGAEQDAAASYFGLDLPIGKILASFPDDPWLERAQAFAPGLRILRQEPWETLCNFICSSLKQIVQIEQINRELRRAFGEPAGEGIWTFPSPERLAAASEEELRACKLGFRARHLYVAARQIAAGEVDLRKVETLPTDAAREELRRVRGVGAKVANCVLLFAYGRLEAFPIDVWVERVLRRLYFQGKRKVTPERLRKFADEHFGPYRGYAQQFLFHWIRQERGLPNEAVGRKEAAVKDRRTALKRKRYLTASSGSERRGPEFLREAPATDSA